mmetsp:Transcript_117313/g.378604  ORF Transcript_117313/g.378604 Transcript_117313/m.378604 type:complete len:523 (+) Transcript_117313:149-1717(+)
MALSSRGLPSDERLEACAFLASDQCEPDPQVSLGGQGCCAAGRAAPGGRRLRAAGCLAAGFLMAMLLAAAAAVALPRAPAKHLWGHAGSMRRGIVRLALLNRSPCQGAPGERFLSDGSPCTPSLEMVEQESEWEVVFNGSVNVREIKDLASSILDVKWKCDQISGHREGYWVKLHGQPGYMIMEMGGIELLRKVTMYEKVSKGTCADIGKFPITDAETCKAAALAMGLRFTSLQETQDDMSSPEGCHVKDGLSLRMATSSVNVGNVASASEEAICSAHSDYAHRRCDRYVTTTVTTTTTRTTTWGWPSLFCFCTINSTGVEPMLVKAQLKRRASIFSCDESEVFSHGRALELGDGRVTTRVEGPGAHPNAFQQVWERVRKAGRYKKHDWTVKVEPDTVFFPHRLRFHVKRHTTQQGLNKFFTNCNGYSSKLAKSIEVFSRQAISKYLFDGGQCMRKFSGKGFSEELFMTECLKMLGSSPVHDYDMLSDKACTAAPCSDTTKVAFHDFGDVSSYLSCLELSLS